MKKIQRFAILILMIGLIMPRPAFANMELIASGLAKTLFSAVQIPADMMSGATRAFPLGLVAGAISGTVKTVVGTAMGAADIARGAAPYAKYAVFAL